MTDDLIVRPAGGGKTWHVDEGQRQTAFRRVRKAFPHATDQPFRIRGRRVGTVQIEDMALPAQGAGDGGGKLRQLERREDRTPRLRVSAVDQNFDRRRARTLGKAREGIADQLAAGPAKNIRQRPVHPVFGRISADRRPCAQGERDSPVVVEFDEKVRRRKCEAKKTGFGFHTPTVNRRRKYSAQGTGLRDY